MGSRLRPVMVSSVALLIGGCSGDSSIVSPKGPAARSVAGLWWPMLIAATAVFLFVVCMLLLAPARGRRKTEDQAKQDAPWGEPFIVIAGVVVSGAILVGFFLFSLDRMQALAEGAHRTKLTVSVIGHDWWWEVRYPNGAVSANEIHIPAGVKVQLALTTDDVIHSFWVPRLGPKTDMIPGQPNTLWLEASEPGVYRGQCAEFCGLQHANMIIRVVADPPAEFDRWVDSQSQRGADQALALQGRHVFESATCAGCHRVRGTAAVGNAGPDLTHLAARATIGAGVLENSDENLRHWITDPQSVKPGAIMPPTTLPADQLDALVAFLRELH